MQRGAVCKGGVHDRWNLNLQTLLQTNCVQWHETDKQRGCIQVHPALLQYKTEASGFDLELMNVHRQNLVCLLSSTSHPAARLLGAAAVGNKQFVRLFDVIHRG